MKQNLIQTLLDGPLAISGTTVDVTNDIVWGEVVNITNADAVLTNRKKTVFELTKVNIVNNVVTFTKRGLTKSETETEDVGLKKSWKKGDYLYITVLAPSFISIDNSQQRQSPQDFSGYTNTFGDTIHNGYAKFQGTTNPGVVFNEFTTAEREALTPIGPAIVYDTTVGEWYKYSGGAWTQISTGGTFPRATDVVEGKVRVQTEDEFDAGDDTGGDGATLVTKPSKIVDQINTEISSIESVLSNSDFMTGEALVEGDSIFLEEAVTFAQATTVQNIGDTTGNTRVSARAIGSGTAGNTLKLSLAKVVSPSVDLGIRIETDNAGEPSGTLVDANATATVAPGDLTTDLADTEITLAGSITIPKGDVVHIVVYAGTYGSETVNGTNYFGVGYLAKDTSTRGIIKYSPTGWANLFYNDTFSGSNINALFRNPIIGSRIYINNALWGTALADIYAQPNSIIEDSNYVKSLNSYGGIITMKFQGICTSSNGQAASGMEMYAKGKLYWDDNNYIEIKTKATAAQRKSSNDTIFCKVVVGGVTTYSTQVSSNATELKIEYNPINGNIKFLYWTTGRQQLGATQTNIFSGNPYTYLSLYGPGIGHIYNSFSWYIDNFYLTAGTFAEQNPVNNILQFPYINSSLIIDKLLSKTDADFIYKLPDIPRIATANYAIGELVKYDFAGISKALSGLTDSSTYYLSNTPGAISTSAGTNKCVIGKSIGTTALKISKKVADYPITVGASPFTWTNETDNPVQIKITGGTVDPIVLDGITVATATSHINTVPVGKSIVITYSSEPIVVYSDI